MFIYSPWTNIISTTHKVIQVRLTHSLSQPKDSSKYEISTGWIKLIRTNHASDRQSPFTQLCIHNIKVKWQQCSIDPFTGWVLIPLFNCLSLFVDCFLYSITSLKPQIGQVVWNHDSWKDRIIGFETTGPSSSRSFRVFYST